MSVGNESHGASISYVTVINHNPSGNKLSITVVPYRDDEAALTEATKDALFQAFLDKLATLSNVTIVSSSKRGEFTAPVTVT